MPLWCAGTLASAAESVARADAVVEAEERDRAWQQRVRAGDACAFEGLFRAYYAPLCGFVRRHLEAPDIAEEVVQSVFLALWRDRAAWTVRGSVRGYLYAAARNGALNHLRRGRTERGYLEEARRHPEAVLAASAPRTPEEEVESLEIRAAVRRAIDSLPERGRMVATLRWEHRMSHAEIAAIMGISIKGVEIQLTRMGRAVRPLLARYRW